MTYRGGRTPGPRVVPPAPSTIDLHTHSNRSDGVQDPEALVNAAADAGIRTLSITDHDTLAGLPSARHAARARGVDLIPGLEINSVADDADGFHEGELHLLGYGVDPDNVGLRAALDIQRQQRRRRFWLIVERLEALGLSVDDVVRGMRLEDDDSLGRPTVARAMVRKGYAESVDDAFRRFLSRGQPAYVPRQGLGPKGAVDAITGAGGLAVLAHFSEAATRPSVVRDLMALGLGGLEVYYRSFPAEIVEQLERLAATLHLVPTGGSDYHGDHETYAEAHAALWVPPEVAADVRAALKTDGPADERPRPATAPDHPLP
jgi:predicted metal-dependent phosphoesterase TrpH